MSAVRTFFYCVGQGIKGLFKNRVYSLASVATISACLVLLGAFYFVVKNLDSMLKDAEQAVGMTVFFDEGTDEQRIMAVADEIKMRAEVSSVVYVSADEAWERYKKESLSAELTEVFGNDNPLKDSASLEIYTNDVDMQDMLVRYVRSIKDVRKVNYSASLADALSDIKMIVYLVSAGLIVILAAVAVFLIRTTITTGINVRRSEISIMSVIGATDFFIRSPFVVEGVLIGLLGSIIPMFVLNYAYGKIVETLTVKFGDIFNLFTLLPKEELLRTFIPISLAFGAGIGFVASYFTARKQVRRIEVEHL